MDIVNPASGTGFNMTGYGAPSWSKDGHELAFPVYGDLWLARTDEDEYRPGSGSAIGWNCYRLSAVANYDSPSNRADRNTECAMRMSISPNGRDIAYEYAERPDGSYPKVDVIRILKFGPVTQRISKPLRLSDHASRPSFSPDGKWVLVNARDAFYQGRPHLSAISIDGKKAVRIVDGEEGSW